MDEWRQNSDYGWSHPSGWAIGRYVVGGTPVFGLWHGGETQGRFEDLAAAKLRHAQRVPSPSIEKEDALVT